ncbi:hypothetical protein [Roseateles sp.]|uniref:hypothetical protein n=1 Tax=Roseateles sp. TaxID=1971397 RepID=UPI00286B6895|nr:hypothetical protein [Roseateles sp.]
MITPIDDELLPLDERIKKSSERTKAAYQDQVLNSTTPCPLSGGHGVPPHGGNCEKCGAVSLQTKSHSILRSKEAEAEVARFYDEIRSAELLGEVPTSRLDNEKGNMIGVLLCVDSDGQTQVLRAFSGFIDSSGISTADGCSSMIPPPDPEGVATKEAKLKDEVLPAIGVAKEEVERTHKEYQQEKDKHATDLNVNQASLKDIYRNSALTKIQKEQQAAPYLEKKAEIERRSETQAELYRSAAARLATLEVQRDDLRYDINHQYTGERLLQNFNGGPAKPVKDVCTAANSKEKNERVADGRTGTCAAPKMLAQAQSLGWTPIAIAEIWIGKDLGTQRDFRSGNPSGVYVPSCECCRSILGFVLCGLADKQQTRIGELDETVRLASLAKDLHVDI